MSGHTKFSEIQIFVYVSLSPTYAEELSPKCGINPLPPFHTKLPHIASQNVDRRPHRFSGALALFLIGRAQLSGSGVLGSAIDWWKLATTFGVSWGGRATEVLSSLIPPTLYVSILPPPRSPLLFSCIYLQQEQTFFFHSGRGVFPPKILRLRRLEDVVIWDRIWLRTVVFSLSFKSDLVHFASDCSQILKQTFELQLVFK